MNKRKKAPSILADGGGFSPSSCASSDSRQTLPEEYNTTCVSLQEELSKKFTPKKSEAVRLADIYHHLQYESRSERVRKCGDYLEFHVTPDSKKLSKAYFCKDRLCPMCNWRRSLKMFQQMSKVMDFLENENHYEFLFLTLTVKNCTEDELPDTLTALYEGWRYLYHKNSVFTGVILGTFRTIEITRNLKTGTYHPHLHCILAVMPSYFKKGYISQSKWVEMWQKAVKADYTPIVDVRRVKDMGKGTAGAVAEVSKYAVKGSTWNTPYSFEKSCETVRTLTNALYSRRLVGFTGVFAEARKFLALDDAEDGDLLHVDDDALRSDVAYMIVRCHWRHGYYETSFAKKKEEFEYDLSV